MKERHPVLTGPVVVELYDRLSFLMWQCSVADRSPGHRLGQLGVQRSPQAYNATLFNHEVGKLAPSAPKQAGRAARVMKRAPVTEVRDATIYVHENGRRGSFTHELAFIPPKKAAAFREWAPRCKRGSAGLSRSTFFVKVGKANKGSRPGGAVLGWFGTSRRKLGRRALLQLSDGGWWTRAFQITNPSC